jgi:hypothetical protein
MSLDGLIAAESQAGYMSMAENAFSVGVGGISLIGDGNAITNNVAILPLNTFKTAATFDFAAGYFVPSWTSATWSISDGALPTLVTQAYISADKSLSALSYDAGSGDVALSLNPQSLTSQSLPIGTTSVNIKATLNDPNATIEINHSPAVSGQSSTVQVSPGNNFIDVSIRAQDNSTRQFNIQFYVMLSSNAKLRSMTFDIGTWNRPFDPTITDYTITLPPNSNRVNFTPVTDDSSATMMSNYSTIWSNQSNMWWVFGSGTQNALYVYAPDGSYKVYTFTFNIRQPSQDATLSNLTTSVGTFDTAFNSSNSTFYITVPSNATSLRLTPTTTDSNATLQYQYQPLQTSYIEVNSLQNWQRVEFQVVPEDTSNYNFRKTYAVIIQKERSHNANLATLTANVGTFTTPFNASGGTSEITVPSGTYNIQLTATPSDTNSSVVVTDGPQTYFLMSWQNFQSNFISLTPGQTKALTVTVTAPDGTTTKSYTVNVVVPSLAPPSNPYLQSLVVRDNVPSLVTLSPSFMTPTLSYTASVANSVSSIQLRPLTMDPSAIVRINGSLSQAGMWSSSINLNEGQNTVTVKVDSGLQSKTYTIVITRAAGGGGLSSNNNLSMLMLSAGTLSPNFVAATQSYSASVANTVSSIDVTAMTADAFASVKVNGTVALSPMTTVPLNVGSNTISVEVTAQNGAIKTYTITVTRAAGAQQSSDATLMSLATSQGTLSPGFAPGVISYTASVANGVTSMTVTPTRNDSNASIKVNGVAVTSGSASGSLALNVGANTITVLVTAQDGSTKTYTITVTRAAAAQSSNNNLSALAVSAGTLSPTFAQATTSYTATVANSVSSIKVTPTRAEANATIKVNGTTVASGTASGNIALSVGANTITVIVTAQDSTTKTYTIVVTRAAAAQSSNNNLSALRLSQGTLSPTFAQATTSYTATVANSVASIKVTPTRADATASITVNGTAVTSGTASGDIALSVGANTITVVVTAQNAATKTYTITVTRAQAQQGQSSDNNLSALSLSAGTLSPAFASGTSAYTAAVANSVSSVKVTATKAESHATISVNGTTVASGTASSDIALAVGANTITVVVTAEDASTKSYTIVVTRATAPVVTKSSDSSLKSLDVLEGTLSPAFSPNQLSYTATMDYDVTDNGVVTEINEEHQKVVINGVNEWKVGVNVIKVVVTAEDGSKRTYTIAITRKAAPKPTPKPQPEPVITLLTTGTVGSKNYADRIAAQLINTYQAVSAKVVQAGDYYRVVAVVQSKQRATKIANDMNNKYGFDNFRITQQ